MTPDSGQQHDDIQGLLPWWANGTLGPEEVRRVEAHLEECSTCRQDVELLMELQETLEEAPAVRRPAPEHAPDPAPRRTFLPWMGWAAAAVLALALGVQTGLDRDPSARSTGVVPTYRLDAVRRSSADTVTIPEGLAASPGNAPGKPGVGGGFQLLLHVDLGPAALPLELEIRNHAGRTVLRQTGIDDLYEGRFLFIHCTPSEVPPGRYLVVLRGTGPGAPEEPLRYSFQVAEPTEAEGGGTP
jgi:hypothetical protein